MLARDIMTRKLIAVQPGTSVIDAARVMFEKNFNGLPVVDKDGKLVGLVNQQDLISHTNVHLPTLINLLSQIEFYKKDSSQVRGDLTKIMNMTVSGVMNHEPMFVDETVPVSQVAETFANHHAINPLLVVDANKKLTGLISRYDILKFFVGPTSMQQHMGDDDTIVTPKGDNPNTNVDGFIKDFETRFLVVSKARTRIWLWIAIGFGIVGFAIAWFLILRLNSQSY